MKINLIRLHYAFDIDQDDLTFNISGGSEITATLVGEQ